MPSGAVCEVDYCVSLGCVFVEVVEVVGLGVCVLNAGDMVFAKVGAEEVVFLMPLGGKAVIEGVGIPGKGGGGWWG